MDETTKTRPRQGRGGAPAAEDPGPFPVLVVDDERLFAQALQRELARAGMACDTAFTAAQATERVRAGRYEAILLDHKLPDDDGIRLIPTLLAGRPGTSIIVMTAYEAIPSAIQAIRQGAEDYLVKQPSIQPLVNAVQEVRRRRDSRRTGTAWDDHRRDGLLGESPSIAAVREQLRRVAGRRDTTVLLTGETGVGKEVAARSLHGMSCPEGGPFVAVDCVALPATLVESLLFGHEKGAFTGADRARAGAFEEAGEGTLFLDEIGEMDLLLQGKLLRVLETRRYHRVGSVVERPVHARVVAATNRDLQEQARQGDFRFDLFQRLSVFPIQLPPLRERQDDVVRLALHFVSFFGGRMGVPGARLDPEAEALLRRYDFPGNVRELKNVVERAIILSDSGVIGARHLPERIVRGDALATAPAARPGALAVDFLPGVDTLDSLERRLVEQALDRAGGVKAEAARLLGISRFQLLRRLEKYGIRDGGDP